MTNRSAVQLKKPMIQNWKLAGKINALQDILYAHGKRKILLILQGMDGSGKDGKVRHVFSEFDPLGIRLTNLFAYL